MINLLRLGQGPRPDLLVEDMEQEKRIHKAAVVRAKEKDNSFDEKKQKVDERLEVEHKDVAAMIIALFQLLLPWLAAGIAIYFLFVFLITRI